MYSQMDSQIGSQIDSQSADSTEQIDSQIDPQSAESTEQMDSQADSQIDSQIDSQSADSTEQIYSQSADITEQMDSQTGSQKRYPGIQLGGVVRDMPHWSWTPEAPRGGPRGEARRARQKRHLPQRGRAGETSSLS
jgi:hypothetical protein